MTRYFLKRLLFLIPTILGIMLINFLIVHIAPGGPVEYALSRIQEASGAPGTEMASGSTQHLTLASHDDIAQELRKRYGFDQPLWKRFLHMMRSYLSFDFGQSYFKNDSVGHLLLSRMIVSISIGLWSTLFVYLCALPLGIMKALRNGETFDVWSSILIIIGYAIPSFLFALALLIFFAGGSFYSWFPLRGLVSENWMDLSWWGKIKDYFWHLTLPIVAQVLSGFAALTLLTKNSFLEEIKKHYVLTARSIGFSEGAILWRYVFRNATLVLVANLPHTLQHILFSGSLLIEMIFSLDGLGLLGYEAILTRDYPVIFGSLYIFTLIGLFMRIMSDWLYTRIDPRIHYAAQES